MKTINNIVSNKNVKKKFLKRFFLACILILVIGITTIIIKLFHDQITNNIQDEVYIFISKNINFIIFFTVLSFIGSIASIISLIPSLKPNRRIKPAIRKINSYSFNHSQFTNRVKEFQQLFDKATRCNIINMFGDKGVGKSETLKIFSDIINESLSEKFEYDFLKKCDLINLKKTRALYFDISDKTGDNDIISELCSKTFSNISPNIDNFIENIDQAFRKEKLIIILDNINNHGVRKDIEKIIETNFRLRPNDVFIIGSIGKFISFKFPVETIEILPFKEKEIAMLAAKKERKLSKEDIENLVIFSQGLPIFLDIILNNSSNGNLSNKILVPGIKEYIFSEIINNLSENSIDVLKCASFLSISRVELNHTIFMELGYENIEEKIYELKRYSMIIYDPQRKTFKVHDQIADIIIDYYFNQSEFLNSRIAIYFKKTNCFREYVLHTLVSNILLEEYKYVISIIENEIRNENLAFLISVGQLFVKFNKSHYLANEIHELYNIILYSYLYATMGIGDYINAANIVKNSNRISYVFSSIANIKNQIEFNYHFLWADLEHLQNKYTSAIQNFQILKDQAEILNLFELKPKCIWGIAHSYRHQGKYLYKSYEYYCECEKESRRLNQKKYLIKSLNGKMCINIVWGNLEFPYSEVIQEIYEIAGDDESLLDTLYSTKKYQSIYLRKIKKYSDAKFFIIEALEGFKKSGKRLIYNMYFELGEYYRDLEEYDIAFNNYKLALDFSNKNLDKNLLTQSKLAIILTEIGANKYYLNKNLDDQINEIMSVIEICELSDLNVNKLQSEIVLLFLKNENTIDYANYVKYLESQGLKQEAYIYSNLTKSSLKHMQLILL